MEDEYQALVDFPPVSVMYPRLEYTNQKINPCKPSIPFFNIQQTVQTQIRCHILASDQGRHYLHKGISIRNEIKMKKYTRHQWTCPIDKDGKVHWVNMG